MPKRYEYIIIGAGPAGLRAAERLRGKARVLILEGSSVIGGSLPEWVCLRAEDLAYYQDKKEVNGERGIGNEKEFIPLSEPSLGNLMVCDTPEDLTRAVELQNYEDIHLHYAMGRGLPESGNNVAHYIAPKESLITEPWCPVIFDTRVTEIERNQLDFCVHTSTHVSYRANTVIVAGAHGITYTRCSPGINPSFLGEYEFWVIRGTIIDPQSSSQPELFKVDTSSPINSYQIMGTRVEAIGDLGYFTRNPPTNALISKLLELNVYDVTFHKQISHYWKQFDDHPLYTGGVFLCGEPAVRHHGWVGESLRSADSAIMKVVSKAS